MGYRHQVISDTLTPKADSLPKWFKERYESVIDFDRDFWASKTEYKRYGILLEFNDDVQKVLQEMNLDKIRLIYFADESSIFNPDISHVTITKCAIVEIKADRWEEI